MVQAVVGANWGDEGKGKIVDTLAEQADIVVRYQGGANAGHTIVNKYGKFALHTLPSGVCHPECVNVLGNGVALNIPLVVKEIQELVSRGVPEPTVLISALTHTKKSALRARASDPPSPASLRSSQTSMPRSASRYQNCLMMRSSKRRQSASAH